MDLLFTIFLLVFLTRLISWVGQSLLLDLVYSVYLRIFYSKKVSQQQELKATILTTKKELLETSSQDQFAKWAKLRRKVDKGLADLDKLNGEMAVARTAFSLKFNTTIWVLTTGVRFVVGWWYRKSPVFYLPNGWFGPASWWLSLPFAPKGSVSCGVWQMACERVFSMLERIVREFFVQAEGSETPERSATPSADKKAAKATPS